MLLKFWHPDLTECRSPLNPSSSQWKMPAGKAIPAVKARTLNLKSLYKRSYLGTFNMMQLCFILLGLIPLKPMFLKLLPIQTISALLVHHLFHFLKTLGLSLGSRWIWVVGLRAMRGIEEGHVQTTVPSVGRLLGPGERSNFSGRAAQEDLEVQGF